jgi:NACHT N-terminal Helical domain 1/NACHT domain
LTFVPLFESLILNLSPVIAKALLKVWLKDNIAELEVSSSIIDSLKAITGDVLARKTADRQLQAIADQVALALEQIITTRGGDLTEEQREGVADAMVSALHAVRIDASSLVLIDLAPQNLTWAIIDASPTDVTSFTPQQSALYKIVASELAQYVIDIASQFPQFSERTAADLLRRDTLLLSVAKRILTEVEELRRAGLSDGGLEAAEFDTQYRRAIVRNLDRMELFGVDLSAASKRYSLSVAYVSLAVVQKDYDPPEDATAVRVEDALSRSNRWLIRGSPGAGKTTLIKWLAVTAARHTLSESLEKWNGFVPFVVHLRQYAEIGLPNPEELPACAAPAIGSAMPTRWAHAVLASGKGLVLVDGIDEIPEQRRPEVQTWLRDLTGSYPNSVFIVSSRPHAIEDDWLASEQFTEAELLEMRQPDILTFIDHWHAAVAGELQDEDERLELPQLADNLKKVISESRSIRNLGASPLLCAIVCALHRDRHRQIPKDRIDLYEACCSMLLERRDAERQLTLGDYPRLTYRQKRVLLEDLAYWMLRNGLTQVNRSSADAHFQLRLDCLREIQGDITGAAVRRFFVERSGMLREPLFSYVDFTHRTFQEFLAARAALDGGDGGVLVEHAHDDQWREAIILATGLAGKQARMELLRGLVDRIRKDDEHVIRLLLLTVQCINAALEVPVDIRQYAEKQMAKLKQPRTVREIKVFAAAGELGLPYLTFAANKPEAVLVASVRELIRIGTDEAMSVLETYARASASGRWPRMLNAITKDWDTGIDRDEFTRRIVRLAVPPENALIDLTPLTEWTSLEALELTLGHQTSLKGLEDLQALREIKISRLALAMDVEQLRTLRSVSKMTLCGPADGFNLSMLPRSDLLEQLEFEDFKGFLEAEALRELRLTSLAISNCENLPPLHLLARLSALTLLRIRGCLVTAAGLEELALARALVTLELTELNVQPPPEFSPEKEDVTESKLSKIDNFDDDDGLDDAVLDEAEVKRHKEMRDRRRKQREASLIDVRWIAQMKALETLVLDASDRIADFGWLRELPKLKTLTLQNLRLVSDLEFLIPLKSLEVVHLHHVPRHVKIPRGVRRKVKEIRYVDASA